MQSRRLLLSGTAIVLALVAGLASYTYLHNKQQKTQHNAVLVNVYTVTAPISRGTPGSSVISGNLVKHGQIPAKYVPSDAVSDLASIQNEVAAVSLAPGAVLESGSFMSPTALSLAAASPVAKSIPAGDIAISVSVSSLVNRVAGLIQPGDEVDMLVQPSAGVWQFLYQNVSVLAVGAVYSSGDTTAQATNPAAAAADATAITFAVPADAAARILVASSHGLYLALVPPGNVAAPQPPVNQDNLIPASITPG